MKNKNTNRLFIIFLLCIPCFLRAGIIVTKENGNIEDVTNITVGNSEISYEQDGQLKSIHRDEVSAILHDNGRYEEVKPSSDLDESNANTNGSVNDEVVTSNSDYISEDNRVYNVFAYGTMAVNFYVRNDTYDGAKVEWRVISKTSDVPSTEYQYLGTTPFAYVTSHSANSVESFYKGARGFITENPLIIDGITAGNSSKVKIEFRVTKEGYEPLVVTPIRKIDFTGLYLFIPLNKLKPIKADSKKETSLISEQSEEAQDKQNVTTKKSKAQKTSDDKGSSIPSTEQTISDTRMIPQGCLNEGKKVYDKAFEEASAKAMQKGYSKQQAKKIADAVALKEQEKTINDCYHRVVELDEEYDFKKSQITVDIEDSYTEAMAIEAIIEMVPEACNSEGVKAYNMTYKEAFAKAVRKGYSKQQADKIADEAAQIEKKKAIDECYNRIVVTEYGYSVDSQIKEPLKEEKSNKEDKKNGESKDDEKKIEYPQYESASQTVSTVQKETIDNSNNENTNSSPIFAHKQEVEFPYSGGKYQVTVQSKSNWQVTYIPNWITVNRNGNLLSITCDANNMDSARKDEIILTDKNEYEWTITIIQEKCRDYLDVQYSYLDDKSGDAVIYTVNIKSNKLWCVKRAPNWCETETSLNSLKIKMERNMTGQTREGEIEITASKPDTPDYLRKFIRLKQAPIQNYLILSHKIISDESGKGGKRTITVDTDFSSYRIEEIPDWCRILQKDETSFVIEFDSNSGGIAREGVCKVTAGSQSKTLTLKQGARLNFIDLSVRRISAKNSGGIITINVQSSGIWQIVNLPEWCQVREQAENYFVLSISKNENGPRKATFSVSASGVEENITVEQE